MKHGGNRNLVIVDLHINRVFSSYILFIIVAELLRPKINEGLQRYCPDEMRSGYLPLMDAPHKGK